MKPANTVLHVPFCYFPDSVGGTEIYVQNLCKAQQNQGVQTIVAAPGPEQNSYMHDNTAVFRYRVSNRINNIEELYGSGDPDSASEFGVLLEHLKPDLVHFHALTRGVSLLHLRETNKRRIQTCFTFHTPTVSCMRGTMMWHGIRECDGAPNNFRCCTCVLQKHGLPGPLASLVTLLGGSWGRNIPISKVSLAVRMPAFVTERIQLLNQYLSEVRQVIAV